MSRLGEKAIACLRMAALSATSGERWRLYSEACERFSEKAVCAKFEDLDRKGYIDFGVSPRRGWLTDKGWSALKEVEHAAQD